MMKLDNPFPLEVRTLFMDCWQCWICGCNGQNRGGLELHHIWGRISGSAFNASVLCGTCHGHMGHSVEEHRRLFRRTLGFLTNLFEDGLFLLSARDNEFKEKVAGEIRGLVLSPFWAMESEPSLQGDN